MKKKIKLNEQEVKALEQAQLEEVGGGLVIPSMPLPTPTPWGIPFDPPTIPGGGIPGIPGFPNGFPGPGF